MPTSKAQKAWLDAHTTRVVMRLNYNTDMDILTKLKEVGNKQGYIKQLIRADISREREGRLSGCEDNFALGR